MSSITLTNVARDDRPRRTTAHGPDVYPFYDPNTMDETAFNVHLVVPDFNSFNRPRQTPKGNGCTYFGVTKVRGSYHIEFRATYLGTYKSAETEARVYNLVCRLRFGNQLDTTPHLLNNLD